MRLVRRVRLELSLRLVRLVRHKWETRAEFETCETRDTSGYGTQCAIINPTHAKNFRRVRIKPRLTQRALKMDQR